MVSEQGCSLISGLSCRPTCLLALMVFADEAPICEASLVLCPTIGVIPSRFNLSDPSHG